MFIMGLGSHSIRLQKTRMGTERATWWPCSRMGRAEAPCEGRELPWSPQGASFGPAGPPHCRDLAAQRSCLSCLLPCMFLTLVSKGFSLGCLCQAEKKNIYIFIYVHTYICPHATPLQLVPVMDFKPSYTSGSGSPT